MRVDHKEKAFEAAIERHLTTEGGYIEGDRDGFDLCRAIFPADALAFIKATQPDEWAHLEGIQKARAEETQTPHPRATDAPSCGIKANTIEAVPVNAATRCNGAARGRSCCNRAASCPGPGVLGVPLDSSR